MNKENWADSWALKWAEGTVLGFVRGNIELNRALGMLWRATEMIGSDKLHAIIENIEKNPVYLPTMNREEKVAKLRPLREALRKGESIRSR